MKHRQKITYQLKFQVIYVFGKAQNMEFQRLHDKAGKKNAEVNIKVKY